MLVEIRPPARAAPRKCPKTRYSQVDALTVTVHLPPQGRLDDGR